MKTKHLLLLLFALTIKQSKAFTIQCSPLQGARAYYVRLTEDKLICSCVGRVLCPFNEIALEGYSGKTYDGSEIMQMVYKGMDSDKSNGEISIEKDLNIKWRVQEDQLTVETDERSVLFLPMLKELEKKYNTGDNCTN